jgi:hypothetical protein
MMVWVDVSDFQSFTDQTKSIPEQLTNYVASRHPPLSVEEGGTGERVHFRNYSDLYNYLDSKRGESYAYAFRNTKLAALL